MLAIFGPVGSKQLNASNAVEHCDIWYNEKKISDDHIVAKCRRAGLDQRQDFECGLLALSDKSKLFLIVLANWSREKNETSARSIAALEESGGH